MDQTTQIELPLGCDALVGETCSQAHLLFGLSNILRLPIKGIKSTTMAKPHL